MKRITGVMMIVGVALGLGINPAQAKGNNGGSAVVTVEVLVNGDVEVTSTKDLSNVHVAVCVDGEVKVVKFDSLNDKVEVFTVEGELIAVLAHSGNNTTAEAEALLELLGGDVNGNSTGVIAFFDEEALESCQPEEEEEPTTTTTVPPTTTTTVPPTTTTTVPPVVTTTTVPAPVEPQAPVTPVTTGPETPVVNETPIAETPAPVVPNAPVPVTELAHTGVNWGIVASIGAALVIMGLVLRYLARKDAA